MEFKLKDESIKYLQLVVDGNGVEFMCTSSFLIITYIHILLFIVFTSLIYLSISAHRDLLEYYLEKEVIEISVNEKNMSLAKIRFVFTRRVQYHLTGTFLQVSCLLLIPFELLRILYNIPFQKCIKISSHYRHLFYYL